MVMASCSFAYSYARVNITAFSVVQSRSGRMRPWAQVIAAALPIDAPVITLGPYV